MRTRTAIIGLLIAGSAPPAFAHPLDNPQAVAKGAAYCVKVNPIISDDSAGNGTAASRTTSRQQDCSATLPQDSGFIAHRIWVYYSGQSATAAGDLCVYTTDWFYNTRRTYSIYSALGFPDRPPCGAGYYYTVALGKVYLNGAWRGGKLVSPHHRFNL
jgi:hypothetical protein